MLLHLLESLRLAWYSDHGISFFNFYIFSWFTILLQNDVDNVCVLGFAKAMQYPSKFQKICYGAQPHPPPSVFFFFSFETFPTTYLLPPLSPIDLLTYIFKLKVDSFPFTYSPINSKFVTLMPTHLPALPLTYLTTL
jgi:hypothetical protein